MRLGSITFGILVFVKAAFAADVVAADQAGRLADGQSRAEEAQSGL